MQRQTKHGSADHNMLPELRTAITLGCDWSRGQSIDVLGVEVLYYMGFMQSCFVYIAGTGLCTCIL